MSPRSTLSTLVAAAFSEDGPLSAVLSNYAVQETQIAYAQEVARTLTEGQSSSRMAVSLLEADTGIGKTLGYLIPLLLWAALNRKRVAVSTATIQLQEQLSAPKGNLAAAIDVTERLTGINLTSSVRVGMRQFVDAERAEHAMDKAMNSVVVPSPEEKKLCSSFNKWFKSNDNLISNWLEQYGTLPLSLQESDICCTPSSSEAALSQYRKQAESARTADVVLINHMILLIHGYSSGILDDSNGKKLSAVVVDEADRLSSMAALLSFTQVSFTELSRQAQDVGSTLAASSAAYITTKKLIKATTRTITHLDNIDNGFARHLPVTKETPLSSVVLRSLRATLKALDDFDTAIERIRSHDIGTRETIASIRVYRDGLDKFVQASNGDYSSGTPLISWSHKLRLPSVQIVNAHPGRKVGLLAKDIGSRPRLQSLILTSATLGDGNEELLHNTVYEYGLGNDNSRLVSAKRLTIERFGEISLVLPGLMPSPTLTDGNGDSDPLWLDAVSEMITEAAGDSKKKRRVLVLTTSFNDALELERRLHACLDERLLAHKQGQRLVELLRQYKATQNSVLISPAAWEGVDLPGMIDELIISRLPHTPPDAPQLLAVKAAQKLKGIEEVTAHGTMMARRFMAVRKKLRQGLGRSPRAESDKVRIWIGDPRFCEKDLKTVRKQYVNALPSRYLVSSLTKPSIVERATIWREQPQKRTKRNNPW